MTPSLQRRHLVATLAIAAFPALGAEESPVPRRAYFTAPAEAPRTMVMLTGAWGLEAGRGFGTWASKQGFNVVVVDGRDILAVPGSAAVDGAVNLRAVVSEARTRWAGSGDKVAVIGFSLGGAGALLHAAGMVSDVAAVVAYVPAVNYVRSPISEIASGLLVPVLVLAAEKDNMDGCCRIETMRALEAAPKPASFALVSYADAGHMFPFPGTSGFRPEDAKDAWARVLVFLDQHWQRAEGPRR